MMVIESLIIPVNMKVGFHLFFAFLVTIVGMSSSDAPRVTSYSMPSTTKGNVMVGFCGPDGGNGFGGVNPLMMHLVSCFGLVFDLCVF